MQIGSFNPNNFYENLKSNVIMLKNQRANVFFFEPRVKCNIE